MIHTAEIIQEIPAAHDIMQALGFPAYKIQQIQSGRQGRRITSASHNLTRHNGRTGISKATVFRIVDSMTGSISFYLCLRIDTLMLATGRQSIELYQASADNNRLLAEGFRTAMFQIMGETCSSELADLNNWNCKRIDYTHNITFPSRKEAELFYRLTAKTSRHTKQRTAKRIADIPKAEQSTAEGNKSTKVIFYDKQKQVRETYGGMNEGQLQQLIEGSACIIRMEVQCKRGRINSIRNRYALPDRKITSLLDETIAKDILLQAYKETVGAGDFYYNYTAKKLIDESTLSTRLKNSLYSFMQLIAQSRSLSQGREQFLAGGHTIKRTGVEVSGTAATFSRYLHELERLNINPVLIPKDWDCPRFLHNPIDQLQ